MIMNAARATRAGGAREAATFEEARIFSEIRREYSLLKQLGERCVSESGTDCVSGILALSFSITDLVKEERAKARKENAEAAGNGGAQIRENRKIAHDLMNVKTIIVGYCELILESEEGEPTGSLRAKLFEAIKRFESVLNLHEAEEAPCAFNLRELLSRELAEPKGTRVEVSGCEGFGIFAGEVAMLRVFQNLVNNASDAGAGRVKVVFSPGCLVRVEDDGKGMPESVRGRLFKEYFTFGKLDGTGVGLSVVKHELDKVGASVSVKSGEGRGSAFTIDFSGSPVLMDPAEQAFRGFRSC
jgi:signal transduction histidine kinase